VLSLTLAPTSGQDALKALERKGFTLRKGRGSHVVVSKEGTPPFVVPLHHELKKGTLNHIVKSSGDFKEGFDKLLK
jgi:predicted RNA binding protein YcfA (HicA-like mRNA interferase family)